MSNVKEFMVNGITSGMEFVKNNKLKLLIFVIGFTLGIIITLSIVGEKFSNIEKTLDAIEEELDVGEIEDIVDSKFESFAEAKTPKEQARKNKIKMEVMKKSKKELNNIQLEKRVKNNEKRKGKTRMDRENIMLNRLQTCKSRIEKLREKNRKCVERRDALKILVKMLMINVKREREKANLHSTSMNVREKAMKIMTRLNIMKNKLEDVAKKNEYIMKHYSDIVNTDN